MRVSLRPTHFDRIVAVTGLFLSLHAVFPLLRSVNSPTTDLTSGDPITRKLWLLVYAGCLVTMARRRPGILELVGRNKLLFALLGWVVASAAWSSARQLTLLRSVSLLLLTFVALFVATTFDRSQIGDVTAWLLAGVVALSAVVAIARPDYGLDHLRGDAWRGVFLTKNELGRVAAFAAVLWLLRAITLRGHLFGSLGVAGACVLVVQRSASRTSLVVLALLALCLVILPALRAHVSIAVPAGAALICCGVVGGTWLVSHSDAVLSSFGADSTFTGRSRIWDSVVHMIRLKPWFGYGYSAFWRGLAGPSAYVWNVAGTTPPHSHNGFLDVWLDLGLVGVALFAGSILVFLGRALKEVRRAWEFDALFPMTVLLFLVFFSISESTLVPRDSLFWLLYLVTAVDLARLQPEARPSAQVFAPPLTPVAVRDG